LDRVAARLIVNAHKTPPWRTPRKSPPSRRCWVVVRFFVHRQRPLAFWVHSTLRTERRPYKATIRDGFVFRGPQVARPLAGRLTPRLPMVPNPCPFSLVPQFA